MSIALMTKVWRLDIPTTDKMVLLALADAASDEGITWVALESKTVDKLDLIKKTSLSRRAIQSAIKRLCAAGYLSRKDRIGKGVTWTVRGCTSCAPQEMPPAPDAPGGAPDAPKPSITRHLEDKSSINVQKPINRFDEFWAIFPHKIAKAAAKKAYTKALKEIDHETLVRILAEHVRSGVWASSFKVHASTWLNGERWTDDVDAIRARSSRQSAPSGNRQEPVSMAGILARQRGYT